MRFKRIEAAFRPLSNLDIIGRSFGQTMVSKA